MADLAEIFGSGKISYDEFLIKAGEMGVEIGDTGELRDHYENEIRGIRCANALERELERSGVKNRELVTRIIDMSSVTVDEDGVHGIAEQIDGLRETDPYLFEGAEAAAETKRVNSGMRHLGTIVDPDRLSDREFYKKIKLM
ncbi:MAG: hypothetical protein E7672_01310 [Ruminococcaceae bacterium]|nr:hypothetical protein [Oscillospiraceae bacterium]